MLKKSLLPLTAALALLTAPALRAETIQVAIAKVQIRGLTGKKEPRPVPGL